MNKYLAFFLLSIVFLFGYNTGKFVHKTPEIKTTTVDTNFNNFFNQSRNLKPIKPIIITKFDTIETTKIDTVYVTVPKSISSRNIRLFTGDVGLKNNNISIGLWNPSVNSFETQTFDLTRRFSFQNEIRLHYPFHLNLSSHLYYREWFGVGVSTGVLFNEPYIGVGISLRL